MSITLILIVITGLISYRAFENQTLFNSLKHYPYKEIRDKSYYRMLTSGFVHSGWAHLIINMYVLYAFGGMVEQKFEIQYGAFGKVVFLLVYLLTIVLASLPSYFKHKDNPYYAAIGASGATSAIVFIYCMFNPWAWLGLFFVIPIPAIIFAVLYLVYSSWADKNAKDNIGHDAHFYGALAGVALASLSLPGVLQVFVSRLLEGPSAIPGF